MADPGFEPGCPTLRAGPNQKFSSSRSPLISEQKPVRPVHVWYTDESKTSSGTGRGVFEGKIGLVFSLGAFDIVFQAEVFALMASIRESIARGYNGRTITIYTDSQAVLKDR